MKKTKSLWIILNSVFLIVFNTLFFVLGSIEYNASSWISYVFIHFAYLMLLLTPKLIREGKSSAIFGFSLFSISAVYFMVEFVTGIVFILISPESYQAALFIQLCIAGIYVAMLVSHMIANERTASVEERKQNQIGYVKDASMKLGSIIYIISDKETKKRVEKAYDALYSSPVKSHPNLEQIEKRILLSINDLSVAVSAGNKERIVSLADSLLIAINERNSQLKALV